MEFTHGRRDIRFSCEEEDQEEDTKNHLLHPSSSSSSDNGGRWGPSPETGDGPSVPPALVEKEHMFDKVVTPSDVGKLNRLVIPKQHAEKYFPLNASVNEKGLLLSFEDRNGKPWRFRYSYWNSSQSYVMTKGWSHFVKEKRLDAGDTVSFGRGVGEPGRDRLFIDWKRRPGPQLDPPRLPHYQPFVSFAPSSLPSPWGPRVFIPPARPNGSQLLYFRPAPALPQISDVEDGKAMILDSVPVVSSSTAATKRVRLFGVNLDCPESCNSDDSGSVPSQMVTQLQPRSASALPSLRLGLGGVESSLAASHPEEQQSPLDLDL